MKKEEKMVCRILTPYLILENSRCKRAISRYEKISTPARFWLSLPPYTKAIAETSLPIIFLNAPAT